MELLVDKEIKAEVENGNLIIEGYKEENVSNTSYDLTVDKIYPNTHDDVLTEISLDPFENFCCAYLFHNSHYICCLGEVSSQ